MSPVPVHPFFLGQQDYDADPIENKLLNDVFFSPAAPGFSKDDVNAVLTEFTYERTSSICSSICTSEDEDYSVQEDNLFLCDLDFEQQEQEGTCDSLRIKRSINEIGSTEEASLASPKSAVKKRKTKEVTKYRLSTEINKTVHSYKLSKTAATNPTIYQMFTKQNIDWCRYCGTTEGINWRPGPWGKRTLCNKHGCDYKGYGFACKLPRLDLTEYLKEPITKRIRPVLQHYCSICQKKESTESKLILCDGCPKAFHVTCLEKEPHQGPWYCTNTCAENLKRKRVVVELPRKRLPLMRTPKSALLQ
ncbi:hypothetical protein BY458DRAFT_556741 [Sporodiniella umbellata]|nr:hypothetical protein BY458DRAFT_556741 [Sporodiniella umbellata]